VSKFKIKPAKGLKVRKPDGDFLKAEGEEVASSVYWRRRIAFREVEIVAAGNAQIPKVVKKEEVKKVEVKKEEPKKQEAKKPEPKKAPVKKAPAKKAKESK